MDPVPVERLVTDLVETFGSADDVPADHRCSGRCSHATGERASSRAPLLDRLAELVEPGSSPAERGGHPSHGAKAGSPAPWDPVAAPLLDEILHGAVGLAQQARKVLGFGPLTVRYSLIPPPVGPVCAGECAHGSCVEAREQRRRPRPGHVDVPAHRAPLDDAGRRALRDLLVTRELLPQSHPLRRGGLVSKAHPARGWRPGQIEQQLRAWHRRAQVVTGHVQPPVVLRQMVNPVEVRADVAHVLCFLGPHCEKPDCRHASCKQIGQPAATKWVTKGRREVEGPVCSACSHPSCVRIAYSRLGMWVTVRCPHCGAAGLPQDPVTGLIYCPRPSCVDVDGGRREWAPSALRHLGLDPVDEPTSRLRYSTSTQVAS